jgi:uncharacterized LabA/DUF88 family protein
MSTQIKKERVVIYIDGNNFYKYLKDEKIKLPKGVKFCFNQFINFLVRERECMSKRYYVGIARNLNNTEKSKRIVEGQQKFLSGIEKEGFVIKRGKVMYDKGRIREKGTDVKIAIDMIIGAIENKYDTAILVSSDTDLIPAIRYIKYKGKKLEYVGFFHDTSLGIKKYANLSILLKPEDVEKFKEKII